MKLPLNKKNEKKMKRIFICLVAVVGLATAVTLKASQKKSELSEMALSNIEALSSGEYNEYVCFGEGNVTCPSTGKKVKDYVKFYDLGF